MKVLFVTKYYPPDEGGIERYSHLLCTGLATRGVEIEVIATARGQQRSQKEVLEGVTVWRMGRLFEFSGVSFAPALPLLMRRLANRFDLIHLNFPNPWAELPFLTFCRDKRSVLTYHSDVLRQRGLLGLYRPVVHCLLQRMTTIIATSPNYIESSPFLSCYRQRCQVIPLPVDTGALQQVEPAEIEAAQAKFGPFVLFVGRLVYYKGVNHCIEAIGRLQGIRLVVVGQGPLGQAYRNQVARMGLAERVVFLGKVDDQRLKALYHASLCLVLPSVVRTEAFGMVLAEAMACGKPVISTELSTGTSFINQDGETGFVVPPGNAPVLAEKIERLVRDVALREAMGGRARARVEELCRKDVVIDRTLKLYEETVLADS